MPLLADNRIPDTTLPDNQFQDGDIFYGDDANKVSDTLKAGVNANYNDIKRLANGELGTVIQPDGSIRYIRLNQDGVLEVSTDNLNYVTTSYAIQDEEGNIANHRPYIYFEGAYVVDNGARIEIHGFQGEQGLTGPQGEQGVQGAQGPAGTSSAVAPQAGFYSLQMESNGDLYVVYPDDETAPTFQYEKETGNLYVVLDGQEVLVGNVAGPQGVKGDPGDDGVSPTVSQTQIDDGWKVTITDATGPHEFTLVNGVSTTISIATIEGGHTVTITDKDGDHAFNVMDGAKGDTGPQGNPGPQGEPGNDGFSPTVATEDVTGGTKVTITDATGPHEFTVLDGAKGDQGNQGIPGNDGFSPTIAVSEISGGHTVTITDASGAHPFNVMDGDDGFSPTVETTPVSGGTQVTITDAEGPHTFNVENGAGIPTGGTTGQYLRKTENGTEWSDIDAISDIDDSQPQSTTTTFSAKSISDMFDALEDNVNAGDTQLQTAINAKPSINDTTASATSVYSSNKVDSLLDSLNVTSLTSRLSTAEGEIDTLQGQMTTAEGEIDTLQSKMTTAESDIDTLQSQMSTANSSINTLKTMGYVKTVNATISSASQNVGLGGTYTGADYFITWGMGTGITSAQIEAMGKAQPVMTGVSGTNAVFSCKGGAPSTGFPVSIVVFKV